MWLERGTGAWVVLHSGPAGNARARGPLPVDSQSISLWGAQFLWRSAAPPAPSSLRPTTTRPSGFSRAAGSSGHALGALAVSGRASGRHSDPRRTAVEIRVVAPLPPQRGTLPSRRRCSCHCSPSVTNQRVAPQRGMLAAPYPSAGSTVQSSVTSPRMCWKSRRLRVARTAPWARAIAAIFRSCVPTWLVTCRSRRYS